MQLNRRLLAAAARGDVDAVHEAVAGGADLEWTAKSGPGRTALNEAALAGHLDVVRVLLAAGADVTSRDRALGYTPLQWACYSGSGDVVEYLLASGADVNQPSTGPRHTPLMTAAMSGASGVVQLLLEAGADLGARAADGQTALTLAEGRGQTGIAEQLRDNGAAPPQPELHMYLPWPTVTADPVTVDYTSPESVLRAFILSMHEWGVRAASCGEHIDWDAVRTDLDRAFDPYCTPRKRAYGRKAGPAVASPPDYDPQERLVSVSSVGTRAELVTVLERASQLTYEHLYILKSSRGRWLVDSKKARPLGWSAWRPTTL